MRDENHVRTIGDYSKPSHKGYMNTIEHPVRNNVVLIRSDTIRLVQNGCSFHGLWSEDPNQHLKDFLKLVDSLDLDGRAIKLHNDILMFQQHQGESLSEAWTRFKDLLQKVPHHVQRLSHKNSEPLLRLEYETTWQHTLNELRDLKMPFSSNMRRSMRRRRKNDIYDVATNDDSKETDGTIMEVLVKEAKTKNEAGNGAENKPIIKPDKGGLKKVTALVDQGSDVNVMSYSTYVKLTDERPDETDIRLSLASHSYIYPLRIVEDVLFEAAEHVYLMDFVILDIKEDERRPFILGTPFLITAKAVIKFDKGTITLRKDKASLRNGDGVQPMEEQKFFKGKHPSLFIVEGGMDDEGEVTLYLMRRSLKVLRKFHCMILGGRFNQLSHVSFPSLSKSGEY
uniref:Zinc finger, CCHC-type n=1 Tax=Tanacetum cinerariifolium TaxID=118510 RepID=A0A699GXF3_TANCI|nr:zinc finger, CCHC-type [Tanacetum cinerariifolium]